MSFVVIVRCANGVVGWVARAPTLASAELVCNVDGFKIPLSRKADETWADAFTTLIAHTVSLRGAVQTVVVAPGVI